jgi:hypothetical protein
MFSGYWSVDQGLVNINDGLIPAVGVIPTCAREELKSLSQPVCGIETGQKLAKT